MNRVAIITESSNPCRFCEAAGPLLRGSGFDFVFVTVRGRGPSHAALEAHSIPTVALDCWSSRDYPLATLKLARLIRRTRIDIIHSSEPIPGIIGGVAGVLARRGVRIFHRHHCATSGLHARLSRLASRLAHMTMVVSMAAAESAHECDAVPYARIHLAYNGISDLRQVGPAELERLRRSLNIPAGAPIITLVARLRPEKGHYTLFEALPLVRDRLSQTPHLLIVGDGPEGPALRERARLVEPNTIHFVGHQEDVAPWFALADIVAMPSYSEPFGLVAVEAMACSKPLVASHVGGLSEVVEDGVSGLLVPPRDPEALAAGILQVLGSPDLAAALSTSGYRRFRERFTLESMIRAWSTCYDDALKLSRDPVNNR